MKVNGFMLRNALKQLAEEVKMLREQFFTELYAFEGERRDPEAFADEIALIESKIVRLQVAQIEYNSTVQIYANSVKMCLAQAVKMVGPASRETAMWRSALHDNRSFSIFRDPAEERAVPVLTPHQVRTYAKSALKAENSLRSAIAKANMVEMELDLDPELFE